MQTLDFSIAVNQARPIEAPGTYLYYYAGAAGGADTTLIIKTDTGGTTIRLQPGQAYRLPRGTKPATRWYIQNYANAATITGVVVIGDGELTDNRITGEVSVIDGGRAKTQAGNSYGGWVAQAAVAGNFSQVQLWNPVGRTVNIAVWKITVSTVANALAMLRWHNAAMLTLWANPNNKRFGLANSTAELRQDAPAALAGNGANAQANMSANVPWEVSLKDPIILPPGFGLIVANATVNTYISASFDFEEFTP